LTNPVSFRLSDDAMQIIMVHAADLEIAKHKTVDRTEALEDIIALFDKGQRTILSRVKKRLSKREYMPTFREQHCLGEYIQALEKDQLMEAVT
jgi:predicted YcjX-like family ATPase